MEPPPEEDAQLVPALNWMETTTVKLPVHQIMRRRISAEDRQLGHRSNPVDQHMWDRVRTRLAECTPEELQELESLSEESYLIACANRRRKAEHRLAIGDAPSEPSVDAIVASTPSSVTAPILLAKFMQSDRGDDLVQAICDHQTKTPSEAHDQPLSVVQFESVIVDAGKGGAKSVVDRFIKDVDTFSCDRGKVPDKVDYKDNQCRGLCKEETPVDTMRMARKLQDVFHAAARIQ